MSLPEQALNRVTTEGVPPETLRVLHQMLRQALNGGVSRPSYDPVANAMFEQVLQQKVAGGSHRVVTVDASLKQSFVARCGGYH